jgi:predicted DNA-binding transcriptional regulator AlpA
MNARKPLSTEDRPPPQARSTSAAPASAARILRLSLGAEEAAEALGVSRDNFDEHIAPDLRRVRAGRRVLYPVKEIERWLEQNASRPLEADR